ncbi:glycosyl hydrolase 115 family protein [Treponema sp. R6D11]
MSKFTFIVEAEAFEGVKRIAKKVGTDFEKVCGTYPVFTEKVPLGETKPNTVIFATLGKSRFVDTLVREGKFESSSISGKREVFCIKFIDNVLLVCGSDKRGTIYGIFALSEYIGVSPLHFWGDVEPQKRKDLKISKDIETVSKEPSVKYRGFFINDEWPCFGTWTFGHYKGFTADMYDHVFELLLRLKGNYLWPAMWTSSFALDGPGNLNEELADIYGILVGGSHHEPCLRASEEWDMVRGQNSIYGNEWNYYKNKNGLLKYWEDALIRSGKYEKIITIGMRGERDSSMLGDDSSLKENIDLLKDIIKNQRELIKKHVNPNIEQVPQVLALYKEVEEYFYGKEGVDGLKDWDELDGVICMLCEDNFGFMRTLPTADIRERKGGFGMYYHFDYHGGPISYEWVMSTSYERTWEQMCMAYDYGIKDIWIVNVGDIKFNEVPLNYFMELAYDFEKWGTKAPNKIDEYTSLWFNKNFPNVKKETREKMATVLHGFLRLNAARRPEALNSDIYHPCHYLEADRMLDIAEKIDLLNEEIYSSLNKSEKNAYYSMIYFPAKSSINLLRMHLYAGKNRHYATQGKKLANLYADLVTKCIQKDNSLKEEFHNFNGGKWFGMELEQHIGFTKWNEDNCRYPVRIQVEPAYTPRLVVSRKDREEIYTKTYGNPMTVIVDDFLCAGNDEVILEIANDGIGKLDYTIEFNAEYPWLEISSKKGKVEFQEEISIRCKRDKLDKQQEVETARFIIQDNESRVAVEVKAKVINVNLPEKTFLENNNIIAINANHFCGKKDAPKGGFAELKNYGRSGCGMKVFPVTSDFTENEEKPSLTYRFLLEKSGDYTVEVWTTPVNSVQNKRPLRCQLETSKGEKQIIVTVPDDFRAGSPSDARWCQGVLDNIRITKALFNFDKGVQEISVSALEAGLVLERIIIYPKNKPPLKSYLGPLESFYFSI